MELYYWPAELKWGIPSFDVTSLHAMTFITFTKAEVDFKPIKRSWLKKKGSILPCLYTQSGDVYEDTEQIIQFLKLKYHDPDTGLSTDDKLNILPFSALIQDKLLPAVVASFWLDSSNYTELTRGMYASKCQYPLNFSVPQRMHGCNEHNLKVLKGASNEEISTLLENLHNDAQTTLNMFSEFLAEKEFLFGEKPSSLDALLFSSIAPLYKIPLPSAKLQNHLKACPNLCQYINRILQTFYKEELRSQVSADVKTDDDEYKYDWVFPVCVAAVAMVSYAANAGLLQVTRV